MISERTLKNWRREALKTAKMDTKTHVVTNYELQQSEIILKLTQEFLDQKLLMKGK